jgi:hypothetical protein
MFEFSLDELIIVEENVRMAFSQEIASNYIKRIRKEFDRYYFSFTSTTTKAFDISNIDLVSRYENCTRCLDFLLFLESLIGKKIQSLSKNTEFDGYLYLYAEPESIEIKVLEELSFEVDNLSIKYEILNEKQMEVRRLDAKTKAAKLIEEIQPK